MSVMIGGGGAGRLFHAIHASAARKTATAHTIAVIAIARRRTASA